MKAFLIQIGVLIVFASCSLQPPDYIAEMARVHNTIEYVPSTNEIKLPHETVSGGTSDCVDMTILLLYNVFMKYGIFGAGAATDDHMVTVFHGEYYDPQINRHAEKFLGITRIYSYAELMIAAVVY